MHVYATMNIGIYLAMYTNIYANVGHKRSRGYTSKSCKRVNLGLPRKHEYMCVHIYMCVSEYERWAQGAIVPPDPRLLARAPPRISSFCVCARVPSLYTPCVNMYLADVEAKLALSIYLSAYIYIYMIYTYLLSARTCPPTTSLSVSIYLSLAIYLYSFTYIHRDSL